MSATLKAVHPGEILRTEFVQPLELTIYRVAKDSGIPQPTLSQIANGKRSITVETALRLGLYFRTTPQFWLNLQMDYDLRQARREKLKQIEKEVHPHLQAA
jgi:antitoxin HigA-1